MTRTTRYATAAVVGCFYTALVVWLVGAEAQSYRKSLRRERDRGRGSTPVGAVATTPPLAPPSSGPAAPPPVPPTPVAVPSVPDATVARDDSRGATQPALPPTNQAAPAPSPSPASAPPEALAANAETAKPSTPAPTATPTPLTPESPRLPATPAVRSPAADWADSLDLTRLTAAEEARLGDELNRLVLAGNLVDREGEIQRLKRAAAPLLANVKRKEVEYKFIMLESDEVNAFSLPGGYLYVSRGLFDLVGEEIEPEQDNALRFALAHEIAHVDLKHALTLASSGNAAAKAQGIDTLNQLIVPIGMGYTDAQEFEADSWAYKQMTTRLGHSRREALMFLVKLQGFSERNGFRNGRAAPDVASGLTLVENHYRAHPAAWDRLDRLKSPAAPPAKAAASPPR